MRLLQNWNKIHLRRFIKLVLGYGWGLGAVSIPFNTDCTPLGLVLLLERAAVLPGLGRVRTAPTVDVATGSIVGANNRLGVRGRRAVDVSNCALSCSNLVYQGLLISSRINQLPLAAHYHHKHF